MRDPFMVPDEQLHALFPDSEAIRRVEANDILAPILVNIRANKPDQEGPFLLAMKQGYYRETAEYRKAEIDERMRTKPRPAYRPMAGPWCGWK